VVISALQTRARHISGAGQIKQGKRGEVLLFSSAVQKPWQMEEGVRPGGSFGLLAQQQVRKLDIHLGDSLLGQ